MLLVSSNYYGYTSAYEGHTCYHVLHHLPLELELGARAVQLEAQRGTLAQGRGWG